jgi:hypothetical protein
MFNIYRNVNGDWKDHDLFSFSENVGISGSDDDTSKRIDNSRIVGIDEDGNVYVQLIIQPQDLTEPNLVERILKIDPKGNILYRVDNPMVDVGGVSPFRVNKNGDIFNCNDSNDGLMVYTWKKVGK